MLGQFLIIAAAETHEATGGTMEHFAINVPHILMQIASFSILAFVIYRWGFKPVLQTMDERQKKISDGLQFAEEMKAKLAETEKAHAAALQKAQQEAQEIVADARDKAKAFLDKQTQEATAKSEDMIKKAQQAIDLERKQMLVEVREEVTQLVIATTSKVLSKELSEQDKSQFSKAAAQELSSVGS